MSKSIDRVEIISGIHRRRHYTAEEKVRLVEQTMQPGMTVSAVARLLRLTLLAPDLVEAILDRRQPAGLTLPALMEPFPVDWREQRISILVDP